MYNPTRRNRNIGTGKQGHGKNNKLVIPQPLDTTLAFYERFGEYKKEFIKIGDKEITVVVEELKKNYFYSCTPYDVERILSNLPYEDVCEINFIVFRQPKKKESILSLVWGRLVYSMEFERNCGAAIIIEAVEDNDYFTYPKKQSIGDKLEFELLKNDGLKFAENKRAFVAPINKSLVRSIQLYRTLIHELGHYSHYLNKVELPTKDNEAEEESEKRYDEYLRISQREKEEYANNYSKKWKKELIKKGVIPFGIIYEKGSNL